jgi:predicted RNase H-like HicB family nuclease
LDNVGKEVLMTNEFTAVIERDGKWYIAYCPEIPGANGQGKTKKEARQSLAEAIALILKDRRQDGLRGAPPDAKREKVKIKGNEAISFGISGGTGAILSGKGGRIRYGAIRRPVQLKPYPATLRFPTNSLKRSAVGFPLLGSGSESPV